MKNKGTHFLVQGAAIAAVYVVLTLVFAPLSSVKFKCRVFRGADRASVLHTGCHPGTVRGM